MFFFVYICMAIGDQNYQDERVGIPLTSLTLSHFLAVPSQDLERQILVTTAIV